MTLQEYLSNEIASHLKAVDEIEDDDNRHWCAGYRKAIEDIQGDLRSYHRIFGQQHKTQEGVVL